MMVLVLDDKTAWRHFHFPPKQTRWLAPFQASLTKAYQRIVAIRRKLVVEEQGRFPR
jgi:hypothetical protein